MGVRIKLLRTLNEGEKTAPQAKVIIDVIAEKFGVGKEVERAEVIKTIEESGLLKTRQPVDRIIAYYQKPLRLEGIIEVIKPVVEKKEKAEKPKKEKSVAEAEAKPEKAAPANAPI